MFPKDSYAFVSSIAMMACAPAVMACINDGPGDRVGIMTPGIPEAIRQMHEAIDPVDPKPRKGIRHG
jgi:hypothetical protein